MTTPVAQSLSSGSVSLRPATRADLPAIVAMRNELNALELAGCPHAPIIPLGLAQFTAVWERSMDSPSHCWRIVEHQGEPVGFALVYLLNPQTQPPGAYLHWAYLAARHRQHGTGKLLFNELLAWARAQGVQRIELQFIEGNEPARRFWSKVGFQAFAQKCVHYLEPSNSSR